MKIRMLKAAAALVGSAALIGPIAATTYGVGTAGATTAPVSPVGTYTVTVIGKLNGAVLNIRSNGHFGFQGGPQGTWTETGTEVQMTGTVGKYSYAFKIHQKGADLGSATSPGTIRLDGTYWAEWYGVPA
jgi:hypothetical protein